MSFDVVVIGAGPGGYVAAIRAAQLGLKVACIEKRKTLGGTCLNVGCIPSKALLYSSHQFSFAQNHLKDHGILCQNIDLDLKTLMTRKDKIVGDLTKGVEFLFKKNKVTSIFGEASFENPTTMKVKTDSGNIEKIETKYAIIATGSESSNLPNISIDEKQIVSSTGALSLSKIPEKMIVLGGGYIGLELGSVWSRLGSKVTVIEYMDRICPAMDQEVSTQLKRLLEKQGMTFKLKTKVLSAKTNEKGVEIEFERADKKEKENTDILLVSVGRRPYTQGLGLEQIGVQLDNRGMIQTDKKFKTSVDNIYAIGDVIKGPMLAHKAEEEGVAVAEILAGQKGHVNYDAIPGVIYTHPEVASVGKTEEELKSDNIPYNVGKFPLSANSRGRSISETDGFIKILAHKETDRVLGVHIIAAEAGTLIAEAVLAIEYGASSEDIARTCHAHPTLNEAFKEAALAVEGRAIHI